MIFGFSSHAALTGQPSYCFPCIKSAWVTDRNVADQALVTGAMTVTFGDHTRLAHDSVGLSALNKLLEANLAELKACRECPHGPHMWLHQIRQLSRLANACQEASGEGSGGGSTGG